MSTQVLATKLHIPAHRSKAVLRPGLIERLNEGLVAGRKLTLISAPAGFGKTTLVSEWAAGCGRPVAWLSLDEGDDEPVRFISYLVAALRTVKAGLGEGLLAALQSPQPSSTEAVLTTLLNEITTVSPPFILVLDDYHVIDAKTIDEALTFLVEHQPPQMHLVVATREDPHLPLARYRARGQLTELRAADLRFTPAEAAEFLNRVMGLNLPAEDIAALESRTEGWIAGLQLAALSIQSREDIAGFIQTFTGSHRFILDYLLEEVLHQQHKDIQAFLLRTAILNRLCGSLCDALLADTVYATSQETGQEMGQSTLEYLERANLFIVPLDNERRWYRYHHLFGDLLRQQLERSRAPGEIAEYHRCASRWYETNGDWAEAFHHALASGEYDRAAGLAEAVWQSMERQFQTAAWIGWVKKLPETVVRSRPMLCVQLGRAFSDVGELETSETYLQSAERALTRAMERAELKSLPGNIAVIRADNAQIQGNLAETVRYAEMAIQLIPEDDIFLRAQTAITLEFTHWAAGNLEASLRAMHAWMGDMQRLGNHLWVIASAFAVADMQVIMGRLNEAEKALRQAIEQAAVQGTEAESVTSHHHLGLALLAHERGDAAAAGHLQTAADLGQCTTLVDWPYRWNMAQAQFKESAGEWKAALASFDEAGRGYVKNAIPILQPVAAHKARVYLKQGRLDKAQAWARERNLAVEDEVRYLDEYDLLTLARVRLAEGSFAGVSDLLDRLLALAERQRRMGSVIEILLTQALVQQAQDNLPRALAALEHALSLAEPEGYLRIFVDEGEAMHLLLSDFRSMLEKQVSVDVHPLLGYVDGLLTAFRQSMAVIPQPKIAHRNSGLIEPLSKRELEVLRLLRSEMSGPEIAQQLFVSLNTLRTHTKNVFNKLGVNSRRAAVLRAEELGLI